MMTSLYQRFHTCRRLPGCRDLHCTAVAAAKGEKFGRRSTRYRETQAANKIQQDSESTPRKPSREPFTRDELPHANRFPVRDRAPLSKLPSSSSSSSRGEEYPRGRREPLPPWRNHGERGSTVRGDVSKEYPGRTRNSELTRVEDEPLRPWQSRGGRSFRDEHFGRAQTSTSSWERKEQPQPWRNGGESGSTGRGAVRREHPERTRDSGFRGNDEPPGPWQNRGGRSSLVQTAVDNERSDWSQTSTSSWSKDEQPPPWRNCDRRGSTVQNPVNGGYPGRSRPSAPPRGRDNSWSSERSTETVAQAPHSEPELHDEFYYPPDRISVATPSPTTKGKSKATVSDDTLPESFTSPPLLPGLVNSLHEMLGAGARPTPIQSLSIKCLLQNSHSTPSPGWREYLLASETGSGKSIAYLLPLLQHLKQAELADKDLPPPVPQRHQRLLNPRGIILAPTHELSRQLSGFAKSLLHEVKLRVLCTSQANVKSYRQKDSTASKMASVFQDVENDSTGAFEVSKSNHPVSLVVGTPMKLLEMVRGRGWDRKEVEEEREQEEENDENSPKPRRGRDKVVHFGKWKSKPELGLANVEWVIVDEADVLFDPDFQETTRTLLADISAARGQPIPVIPASSLSSPNHSAPIGPSTPEPIKYPFNLILTSATIPKSLNAYLEKHHPALIRLASPRLHHLPKTLQTEHVSWTGGNKFPDILRRIKKIWAEDAAFSRGSGGLSKVLLFCNKSTKVVEFSAYLTEQGIKNVAMTSQSEHRGRGSNKHLEGFLRTMNDGSASSTATSSDVKEVPHVMVTTSILSRGLDFSPDIKHVFIIDEPRNTIDFLHRAGRTGRAGQHGKVVIFGKLKGRGSQRAKDTRKRIGALAA